MYTRLEGIEILLNDLESIVSNFNRAVINYMDCIRAIDGTLVESEYAGDIDEETLDHYLNKTNEIIRNMPPVNELEDFLFKYHKE